jgi:hypothetical protein
MKKLHEIKNFGPKMVKWFNDAGFETEADLLASSYPEIMKRLKQTGVRFHWNIVYSMEMGLQNRAWNDIREDEKKALRDLFQPSTNVNSG